VGSSEQDGSEWAGDLDDDERTAVADAVGGAEEGRAGGVPPPAAADDLMEARGWTGRRGRSCDGELGAGVAGEVTGEPRDW
jgi:hypothetical protein